MVEVGSGAKRQVDDVMLTRYACYLVAQNGDPRIRAVWDEEHNHWWFSALDIVGAINQQDDHEKNRNYWKYLKAKLRKERSEVVSDTTQLKLTASDGKKYNTDMKIILPTLHPAPKPDF